MSRLKMFESRQHARSVLGYVVVTVGRRISVACSVGILFVFAAASATHAFGQESSLLHQAPPQVFAAPARMMPGMSGVSANSGSASGQPRLGPAPQPRSAIGTTAGTQPVVPRTPDINPAIGLRGVSWTYQPAPPLRQYRMQDIITIRVDEISRAMAEGEADKKRQSLFSAALSDWVKLTRNGFVPDPLEEGEPTVAADSQSTFRSEASIESRESLSFNIAARIVDIRPNGNLVLEARKKYRINDNLWETSLSGICRSQDIGPDNVVLSKDLIDLEIQKEDRGYVRDGYQRGWFQRFFDRVKPF
ncbi:flagellar L-ring protein precursor FlgH [Neorhodopirellula lusitana]|uniref:Flagellar L-ring protein FlgH n=1 Tax=Neorhodopirellula lusitana TaxID=445327 RepID=A0ABY1QCY2_9BACT|nr:flagellar basal body L-ring protein FlgH [Neorhodopirellula lusitana]SMP63522.1 flagellar L-ring protein precursor FlgH [Neorhodopirellula lusitana]